MKFADAAITHLAGLTARERSTVVDAIEEQLSYEPLVETRNRKLLKPNPIASWELRVGALHVFYDVVSIEPVPGGSSLVRVLAVGKKERNELRIGGKVIQL
ncbi:MAG: type II toxin-antitoxin system RelE/ParE family toxin [Deltaproteobacteria bacterium]|nr:type II toxin-antitoxin system RelE/ParE family toxin [Deltaproteobacteria bacterium]